MLKSLSLLWFAALFACAAVGRADGSSGMLSALSANPVNGGIPGAPGPFMNPGGDVLVTSEYAASPDLQPIHFAAPADDQTITATPGDLVFLIDPLGSHDASNWAAVMRFLNPADPTGSQGLMATRVEDFFPDTVGSGGFSQLNLMPNVYYFGTANPLGQPTYTATWTGFGPYGGILSGQLEINVVTVFDLVPEPGPTVWLGFGGTALAAGMYRRRRARLAR